ncbi:hypothetical protein BDP27DRAFT_1228989, partial [Rhodocollybia butyracea]
IDDQYGDPRTSLSPLYSGSGDTDWVQGANCSDCEMAFNGFVAQQAFNQTWHWSEFLVGDVKRTVKFNFTGTSLNVYCILPNPDASIISNYNLTFTLDGTPVNHGFNHTSDGSGQFQYNVNVLSLGNLSQAPHTFVMAALTQINSTVLFDYATCE